MKRLSSARPRSRPAGPRMKLRACLGPLLAWALTAVSPALALSELDQDWLHLDLPQRDTLVDVDTNFGLYRLPIGYLSWPRSLKSHEVTADPVSGRHRYSLVALLFHFTMPDGHQNTANDWYLRWNDHGGDDIGIDPRRYLVGITGMERPSNGLANEIVVLGAGVRPNHLGLYRISGVFSKNVCLRLPRLD